MQLVGRFLDYVNLSSGKPVTGIFAPLGDAVHRVEVEAQRFDLRGPIRTGLDLQPLHVILRQRARKR